ncbi:MAG: hypothetical protein F7C34_00715 [Desulfurococcales archaeon]|nr:hypothetical protein [Desulfurococcales archaeon]
MPNRRAHVVCSYLYSRSTGASLPEGAAEAVNTIIDHPGKAKPLLRAAAEKLCSEGKTWECTTLRTVLYGFRVPGVAVHDWKTPKGALLLRRVVASLYGEGAVWLVDLHYALDCAEQSGKACMLVSRSMIDWVKGFCREKMLYDSSRA